MIELESLKVNPKTIEQILHSYPEADPSWQSECMALLNGHLATGKLIPELLRPYYGFLVRLLNCNRPQHLCKLICSITDSSCVTYSRLRFVRHLYSDRPYEPMAMLLQKMTEFAPSDAYVSSYGQKHVECARLPLKATLKLVKNDLEDTAFFNTKISRALHAANGSEALLAEVLASVLPLAVAAHRVPLAVQEFAIKYLSSWDGTRSSVIDTLAHYFVYWRNPSSILDLIEQKCTQSAAVRLVQDLVVFGPQAKKCIDKIATYQGVVGIINLIEFYKLTETQPPKDLLWAALTVPCGIFMIEEWADQLPEVCQTLQGTMALPDADLLPRIFPFLDFQSRFAFANNPWLGAAVNEARKMALKDQKNAPVLVTAETLGPLGLKYEDFCYTLLNYLSEISADIEGYL